MEPVGLGNTRISTDYAPNSPRTLPVTTPMKEENQLLATGEPVEFAI